VTQYYAIHAINLLKMINSDINYMNLRFEMGAVNSLEYRIVKMALSDLFLKVDWNPVLHGIVVIEHVSVPVLVEIN